MDSLIPLLIVLGGAITAALIAVDGALLVVTLPLLLYLIVAALSVREVDVSVSRSIDARHAAPGDPVTVTVLLTNRGDPVPELLVADRVPAGLTVIDSPDRCYSLARGETREYSYRVRGSRGSYRFTDVVIEHAGDCALRSYETRVAVDGALIVLPDHRSLSRVPIAPRRTLVYAGTNPARIGGEGTEFFDVAEFRRRAPVRRVNWKLTARYDDRVFVNEYQQERVADVAVVLDCRQRAYADAPGLFEAAASATASVATALVDTGNRVGFLSYGMSLDWVTPGFGRVQRMRILTRIASARPGTSHAFETFTSLPSRLFPAGSQLIIVTPLTTTDVPGLTQLISRGHAVLVASPDPTPQIEGPADDPVGRGANRVLRAERAALIARVTHAAIPVISWTIAEPFEDAVIRSMGAIREAWRRRRR